MLNKIKKAKYFIGAVSLNTIDSVIDFCNKTDNIVGLIPSRRQIDYNSGYVGINTKEFVNYVRSKTENIIIERDHSGIGQGQIFDTGTLSQHIDAKNNFDIIHIDPWKIYNKYNDGLFETIESIKYINSVNNNCLFEVGTEETIRKFEIHEFENFLGDLKKKLGNLFFKIKYSVIQSGTKIIETKNVGKFDINRLNDMVSICDKFNILSKEHNGDYLSNNEIEIRFDNGLSAINIAPEFGVFETDIILKNINDEQKNILFKECYNSGKWMNWVNVDFNPNINKNELIRICGHYNFNTFFFKELSNDINVNDIIKDEMFKKLEKIHKIVK